jgi:hypothetical protein
VRELQRGKLSKLVVNERQQLVRGMRVALLDGSKDLRDITHVER